MSVSTVCPNCQHPNPTGAVKCEKCGTPLPADQRIETVRFADLPELAATRKPGYQGKVVPGFIAVYVMDETAPLLFEDKGTLTFGRSALGEKPPTINLTRYHAGLLGVSRRHAAIEVLETEHTITDLNSSNGTWLNQEPLIPGKPYALRSGDAIRLGHLALHVYFEETGSNGEGHPAEHSPAVKTLPPEQGEVNSISLRLVGRPGPVEYRQNQVTVRMLYLPPPETPDDITALPVTPTRFTIQLTPEQWDQVKADAAEPDTRLVVEGTCTYGKENAGIIVHAEKVSVQKPEAPPGEAKTAAPPANTAAAPKETAKPAAGEGPQGG
ncbi:MAG: FHA domain-containing protein [Chloroflexi bacterium]|nr:FHA domain-containing protein [Chloroflexota bacterium]